MFSIAKSYIFKIVKLFNTLTRRKDEFAPQDGKTATVYSCGPTVYSTASIGNLRAYVCWDVLKKSIEMAGFGVNDVMNTTDVGHLVSDADDGEDKVEKAARASNTTPQAIAQKYTEQFFADCARLNIRMPKTVAPATDYIPQMIDFVRGLEKKGFTYKTSDGIYFDSSKFAEYNKLSRQPIDKNIAGARVNLGEKRGSNDFALWKFVTPNTLQKWESPWHPMSCPGWHIECSAIARAHFGDTVDIHTGGIDHIPIHHTNEIAQTESLTGKQMARFWLHNEFITVDGKKMSKSLGNVYTIDDIVGRGVDPLAYRYYCLLAHYRSILNFTWDGLDAARRAYENLIERLVVHKNAKATKILAHSIRDAILDDLNTPKAIGQIWELVKSAPSRTIYDAVIEFDAVLSLDLKKRTEEVVTIPKNIVALADRRMIAKREKDFATADKLRSEIAALGYEIMDTKDGYTIKQN